MQFDIGAKRTREKEKFHHSQNENKEKEKKRERENNVKELFVRFSIVFGLFLLRGGKGFAITFTRHAKRKL